MTDTPAPALPIFEQLFRGATAEEAARPSESEEVKLLWVVPVPTLFNSTAEASTGVFTEKMLRDALTKIENEPLKPDIYPDTPFYRNLLGVKLREIQTMSDEPQVLDTIRDHTATTYRVDYRHTEMREDRPDKKSWVVEHANVADYPEAHQKASALATMYAHVRVVRIEKTERLTVAWASGAQL